MPGKKKNFKEIVRRFRGRRVAVLGDFMLDRFIRGRVSRLSPEAPVPLVRVARDGEDHRLGGAGNVVANLAALGAQPLAIGITGADAAGKLLRSDLKKIPGAREALVTMRNRITTVKTRVIAQNHHVVRVDWEDTEPLPPREQARLIAAVRRVLPKLDALILSDYDKGVLSDDLLEEVLAAAGHKRVPVFLDLKVRRRLDSEIQLVQVNRQRAEEILGRPIRTERDRQLAGGALRAEFPCQTLVLTLGSEGMRVFAGEDHSHLAAVRSHPEVFDVTGAGDTVLSTLTLATLAGAEAGPAAELANVAAGVVVGKLGTAQCTREELLGAFGVRPAKR